MGEKLLSNKAAKIAVEDIVQKVMDIFEAEDGRVFEEKNYVYVEGDNGIREAKWVTVGLEGNDYAEIVEGKN